MGVCDDILKKDIVPSCDDPVVQGLEQEGVIMNRADVDFAATVFNSTKKNVIETLAMKTGKKAYKVVVPGKNPFTGTKTSLVAGTYRSSFTNTVAIVILAKTRMYALMLLTDWLTVPMLWCWRINIRVYRKKETLVMPLFRCMVTTKGLQLQLSTTISIARILKVDGLLPWKSRKRLNLHYSCSRRVMKQLRQLSTL